LLDCSRKIGKPTLVKFELI